MFRVSDTGEELLRSSPLSLENIVLPGTRLRNPLALTNRFGGTVMGQASPAQASCVAQAAAECFLHSLRV